MDGLKVGISTVTNLTPPSEYWIGIVYPGGLCLEVYQGKFQGMLCIYVGVPQPLSI